MFTAAEIAEIIFVHRELGRGICLCSSLLENADIAKAFAERQLCDAGEALPESAGRA